MPAAPLRVALINDYELVVTGLHAMLAPFAERIAVVDLGVGDSVDVPVDVALFDAFGPDRSTMLRLQQLVRDKLVDKVVLYTWAADQRIVADFRQRGVAGVISKALTTEDLVAALEKVAAGARVVALTSGPQSRDRADIEPDRAAGNDWPGRDAGLTMREAEMIAMITQGMSNAEIAETAYLSLNSVKSYIRGAYRKMGVTRRSQAVAWGLKHGLTPDQIRRPAGATVGAAR